MPKVKQMRTKEMIILVDPRDRKIGEIEKILAHEYAMLHRAFSVFIFRQRNGVLELLLQQRSKEKYHAGGLWTNTCCSHPHPGETVRMSAEKRLQEEMGIKAKLREVGKFHYVAQFDNGLTENEIDHVFIGMYQNDDEQEIPINPKEVESYEWMDIQTLQKQLALHPKKYTPWFKPALELALKNLS